VNPADLSKRIDEENIQVTMDDFISALNEVKPAFGAVINTLEMCRFRFPKQVGFRLVPVKILLLMSLSFVLGECHVNTAALYLTGLLI
jgi:uncharacterized ion transporter superfamily protein YfcC